MGKKREIVSKDTATDRARSPIVPDSHSIVLVGTCKEKQLAWIKKNGIYNYPVKDGDEFDAESFAKIKELWLYAHAKGRHHCFSSEFIGKMSRDEFLAAYPTYAKIGRGESQLRCGGRGATALPTNASGRGRSPSALNGAAVSTKPPHEVYYVFKTSFLDYGPKLDDPIVVARSADFGGCSVKVKKAIEAFKNGGEFGSLADFLPSELSQVPRERLRVCDSGVRLHVWSPVKGMTPQLEKIESVVSSVAEFGRNRSMTAEAAYNYLAAYAGLDFLDEHYSISRCYTDEMIDESLSKVCRNHGGALK